jgi:predicted enzyme related to lactoylglutathione lyase
MVRLTRIAPEIPVLDLPRSIEYYERQLGFRLVMEMTGSDYAIVERDDVAIHLFEDRARRHSPVSIHIFASHGLEELQAELRARGAQIVQEIERKPWRNRDFRVRDDSGNEIKFWEPAGKK